MDNLGTRTLQNQAKNVEKKSGRYMPGLDGLRALAVIGVILYHLNLRFIPGGLLGVGVFFVLSGYLITDILFTGWRKNARIDLKDFWVRRARRLLPALLFLLLCVTAWSLAFGTDSPTLRGDLLAALVYVSNWWFIFHHVSYFASFAPSPLGHLWSLAVEEQFYLMWPLLLIMALKFCPKKGVLALFILCGATASTIAMAVMYQPGTDPSRVYYGTDTRSFELLIGALLAVFWPSTKLSDTLPKMKRLSLDLVGTLGIAGILVMYLITNEYEPFLYRGGMVVLSLLTAAAIAMLAHPASPMSKVIGWAPLRWIGIRSYGIYLWHYPVIILTTPSVNTDGVNITRAILQVGASVLLAAFSYRFIEKPIRYGSSKSVDSGCDRRQARRERRVEKRIQVTRRVGIPAGLLLTLGVLSVYILRPISVATASATPPFGTVSATAPPDSTDSTGGPFSRAGGQGSSLGDTGTTGGDGQSSGAGDGTSAGAGQSGGQSGNSDIGSLSTSGGMAKGSGGGTSASSNHGRQSGISSNSSASGSGSGAGTSTSARTTASGAASASHAGAVESGVGMTAIGDSVMIDIEPYLQRLLPGIVVDGKVGRQMIEAPSEIARLRSKGELGSKVFVLELGTNGPFTEQQLTSLLNSLSPVQHIVLVNTRVPRPWQDVVNQTLSQVVKRYPNATLVDWYSASAGHNSYFYGDGVHLNPSGAQVYAQLVAAAIKTDTAK